MTREHHKGTAIGMAVALALVIVAPAFPACGSDKPPPARVKVSGYGLLGDLRLERMLKLIELQNRVPQFLNADFIEDSALILRSALHDNGHARPVISVDITLKDGHMRSYVCNQELADRLPHPLEARAVHFHIQPGPLYDYTRIRFVGLNAIRPSHARAFFIETSGLIPLKKNRVYSPERMRRSVSNLRTALNRRGFQDAQVTATNLNRDNHTGAVTVEILVHQGPKSIVRSVRQQAFFGSATTPSELKTNRLNRPYSKFWEENFIQGIKTNYYTRGYPDVSVSVQTVGRGTTNKQVYLDLLATIHPGPRVRVGHVGFEGNKRTKTSFLKHRVPLKRGDLLDRTRAEDGRYRLSRLGIFESVDLIYHPQTTNIWDVDYRMKEGKRINISLLFGFGTYDLLRGGVEINQYNLWGLAHNQRLQLVQSFKSSSGEYRYTIPELLGENADVFFNASGLRREEISFVRQEYGGGAGIHKFFHDVNTDTTLRYNYGILQATEASANFVKVGAQSPAVGEVILDAHHNRLDNPLAPRRGYKLLANVELATRYLGGDATFQRVEVGASCHIPLGSSDWLHLGLRHGVASTLGGSATSLPFVRRFFPGGEDTVRGYQEGEASPRNAQGQIVGAQTYLLGNVELEQALTPKWSIVAFVDGVGFAKDLNHYPEDKALFSAGGGIQWRTLVGPVRIEYGYNLNPRPLDPAGTLQFSLGFPF